MAIMLTDVRLAFPDLWKATKVDPENENEQAKYRGTFLLPADSKQVKTIHAEAKKAAQEKWGEKWSDPKFRQQVKLRYLHDGDEKSRWDGFEGMQYVAASNTKRPLVIDRDRSPLTEADGKVYAGCYVNVRVEIWAQDNKWGKALNVSLLGVQFARDGDSFGGGRVASVDEFEDLEDEELDDTAIRNLDDPLS